MHCHTKEGSPDSHVSLRETISVLKRKGYDGMVVTDHNSYRGYNTLQDEIKDFVVLRGVEYDSLDGGHLLIVLPTKIKYEIFEYRGMYAVDVIKIVHALGGIVGPAHPFDYSSLGICNTKLRTNIDLLNQFDFFETFNACLSLRGSLLANYLANYLDKPCVGGSDSHSLMKVGLGRTEIPCDIRNEDDLIQVIQNANYNTLKASGTFFERKHQKLHTISTITAGYLASTLNKCLSYNRNKKTMAFFKALGIE
jgi:predicted metal-dependent phosphoesterase TrpH